MTRDDRYILFQAGGVRWAIAARGVLEVLPTAPLERPAGSPRALAGFLNLGGQPLAVIRLAALFAEEATPGDELYHHIMRLAVSHDALPTGLLVDRVTDADARANGVAPLDDRFSVNGAVIGNLNVAGDLVPLLDWGRLLLLEEERRIAQLAEAMRTRLAEVAAPQGS